MKFTRTTASEDQTAALGKGLARLLRSGDVVLLEGQLGAGKTALVRAIATALGADPGIISSPTYVIVNQYPLKGPAALERSLEELVHVDAYRLHHDGDLESAGWDRLVDADTRAARPGSAMAIEWPDRIAAALPARDACLLIELRATDPTSRTIDITIPAAWTDRPEAALLAERAPVRCRITGAWVDPTNPHYPFADERAKMADLGRWFSGSYRLSREAGPDELEGA